jgi:hypothetical protein
MIKLVLLKGSGSLLNIRGGLFTSLIQKEKMNKKMNNPSEGSIIKSIQNSKNGEVK